VAFAPYVFTREPYFFNAASHPNAKPLYSCTGPSLLDPRNLLSAALYLAMAVNPKP